MQAFTEDGLLYCAKLRDDAGMAGRHLVHGGEDGTDYNDRSEGDQEFFAKTLWHFDFFLSLVGCKKAVVIVVQRVNLLYLLR